MCENKRTGYGLKHTFSQLFPELLIPLTMNVGLLITMKTHSWLVIPFIFLFCGYSSGRLPLLLHIFFLSLTGRKLIPQFPLDSPSYLRRCYTFSLSYLLGSCSPVARQSLGQCPVPCHPLSDSGGLVLRSLCRSFSLAVFGNLFYKSAILPLCPNLCFSGKVSGDK